MPMTWDAQADARLLVAIIKTSPKINWKLVAELMGDDCTEYALGHRIKKLRKIANESGMSVPNTPQKATSGSAANTPKAPKSAKKAAPETPTQTPGKKRKSMIKTQDELVKEEEGEKKPKLEDAEEEGAYYF